MWIMAPEGFYSIVKGEDIFADSAGKLQVRARAAEDLERLREWIPDLGPTIRTPDGDYLYRAFAPAEAVASGFAAMMATIDYANFKNEVARIDPDRSHLYARVWGTLLDIQHGAVGRFRRKPWRSGPRLFEDLH